MGELFSYEQGIFGVDAHYVRPKVASIHLIVENGHVAIIDAGCNSSVSNVLSALENIGVPNEGVDFIILTHVHLDHAGGAGLMMKIFPNALLVVHPRGARHMADPSKLIEGSAAVYGKDEVFRLYGQVVAIDAARIIEATDGMCVDLAGRQLLCLDTPGHAKHHIAIIDGKTGHIFTGDIFGISYRELDIGDRQFVFLTTTPVQFEPDAMHASIDRLLSYQPKAMYLTHFSQICNVPAKGAELHRLIDAFVYIAERESVCGPERHSKIRQGLADLLLDDARRFGCVLAPDRILELFDNDLELNAQGLGVWLDRR